MKRQPEKVFRGIMTLIVVSVFFISCNPFNEKTDKIINNKDS